jgi:hypothetical protein
MNFKGETTIKALNEEHQPSSKKCKNINLHFPLCHDENENKNI